MNKFLKILKKNKLLLENLFFLCIIQGVEMFVPLITFRFLIQTIGVEKFGLLNFVMAFVIYFQILIDYGFNVSATRDISLAKASKKKINIIVNRVLSTKIYLLIFSFFLFTSLVFVNENFRVNWKIYILYFGVVIGYTFCPTWFYQGIQNMRKYTIINAIIKVISLLTIISIIKEENDYWLAPFILSLAQILIALTTSISMYKSNLFRFKLTKPKTIIREINNGKFLFLSELKASLFTNTNTLILGMFSTLSTVAYFTSADKLARSIRNIQIPISNALFPYLTKEVNEHPVQGLKKVNKITFYGTIFFSLICLFIGYFSEYIIVFIFTDKMLPAVNVFKILLFIPIFTFIDTMYGKQILLNLKEDKLFFKIFLFSSVLCLLLSILLTYFYSIIGTSIAIVISQAVLAILMVYYAQKIVYEKY